MPPYASAALKRRGPTWSEVAWILADPTQLHLTMAVVKRVDVGFEGDETVKLEPGRHAIVPQSPTWQAVPGTEPTVELDVEPCKRYDVNAQFGSSIADEWKPALTLVEKVPDRKLATAK